MNLLFIKQHRIILLFIFILFIAILPRLIYFFGEYDYFEVEPAHDFFFVKKIVIEREVILTGGDVGGIGGFHKGPLYYYLLAIPFALAKGDPYSGKVFMLIQSILTVVICYFLVNKMINLKTAVFISFFLSISPYLIFQSGRIWNPFVLPIVIVIFLYFLYKVFQKQFKFTLFIGFLLGIMTSFEIAVAGTMFIQLVVIAFYFLVKRILPVKYFLLSFTILLFTLSPYFFYDLNNNFYNTKGVFKMISLSKNQTGSVSIDNYSKLLENRIETFKWNFLSAFTPHRIVGPILFILICFSAFFYLKNRSISFHNRLFVLYLAASPFFIFIIFLFYPGKIFAWWLLELTVFYCFLVGILSGYYYKKFLFRILVIVFIIAFLKAAIYRSFLEYKSGFTYPPKKYTIRRLESIDYIFKNADGKFFKVFYITSSSNNDDYKYLTWWKGSSIYNYVPEQKYFYYQDKEIKETIQNSISRSSQFYILLEYNPENKNSLTNWIDNYDAGKIIETKYFQDRFVVQKRSM